MRSLVGLFCLLILAACANVVPLPSLPPPDNGPYKLDTGDVVRVLVYNQDSLSNEYTVAPDGTIAFPTTGQITARGRTVPELQQAITAGLGNGVLVAPGVSVEIKQYRPFYVVGEVVKPGQYAYTPGMNVLGAVAVAGGYTVRADDRRMSVVRKDRNLSKEWYAEPYAAIQPGDVVVIHEYIF